eukprot:6483283-Amphidinium_carterae.1
MQSESVCEIVYATVWCRDLDRQKSARKVLILLNTAKQPLRSLRCGSSCPNASKETLVAVADLLFRTLKADSRFERCHCIVLSTRSLHELAVVAESVD